MLRLAGSPAHAAARCGAVSVCCCMLQAHEPHTSDVVIRKRYIFEGQCAAGAQLHSTVFNP
jgi:hypothetical protein